MNVNAKEKMINKIDANEIKYFLVCLLKITINETNNINKSNGILLPDKIRLIKIIINKIGIKNFNILGEKFL